MNSKIALFNLIFWGLVILGTVVIIAIDDHLNKKYRRDEKRIPITDGSGKVIKYISENEFHRDCFG